MSEYDQAILDPTGDGGSTHDVTLAPRLATLRGKTLALLDNGKPNALSLLSEIGNQLREQYQLRDVRTYTKSYFGTPVEESQIQRILHNCAFAVAGIGD